MTGEKPSLLKYSWSECEEVIASIGMRNTQDAQRKLGKTKWSGLLGFLKSIGFIVNDANFTEVSKEYYKSRFILKDKNLSTKILANTLKQFRPTQAICQLLWGRPNLSKESVYRLLIFEEFINPQEFKDQDLGGFLMLLNQCGILKYSKKANRITILYNPRTKEKVELSTKFLSPETPYSNVRNLREIVRNSTRFIHWFDKHFSAKGLEPLTDEADGIKINEIKILTGVTSSGVSEKLKRDFVRFVEEMKTRQIKAELRVICDKSILQNIHDRWIISERISFNVPPIDSIFQGQYSEMNKTENRPPFEEWWSKGLDIIECWQEIAIYIESE